MSLGSAVDSLLHAIYKGHDATLEMENLRDSFESNKGRILDDGDQWSGQFWDLFNAVDEYLKDSSWLNLDILKRTNLEAYPFKEQTKAKSLDGYIVP